MSEAPENGIPESLKRLLEESGAQIHFVRLIDHGIQYRVTRGSETATLNVYYTGKVSVGGKSSALLSLLEGWRLAQTNVGEEKPELKTLRSTIPDGTPRVGADEAGKGDYFGPLVVAGVRILGEKEAWELREIGVRDSKTLSVLGARDLAQRTVESVGPENVRVVVLPPREYEKRRKGAGNNVNKILAEVNVQIFEELKAEVSLFVVDEFGKAARSYIEPWLQPDIRLVVRTRGEEDVAVAAASILARARYLNEMDALSREVGFELPRGATHVVEVARQVVEERGMEGLEEVAKVHFGTTAQVIEALEKDGGRREF